MKNCIDKLTGIFALALCVALPTRASDLFVVNVSGAPGGPITVGSSNVVDLVDSLVNTSGEFQSLNGMAFNGDLTFMGIPNAITFSNNANSSGIIYFNLTGQQYSYSSYDDLENFLKDNGLDIYAEFLKAVDKKSAAGVSDGNPRANTASASQEDFTNFGMTPVTEFNFGSDEEAAASDSAGSSDDGKSKGGQLGIGFNSGTFEVDQFGSTLEGRYAQVGLTWLSIGGSRVRLQAPLSATLMDLEGALVYGVRQSLALPIRLSKMDATNRWNWRITPVAGVSARVSPDALSGSILWQAGLTHSVDYRVNHKLIVCMINQLSLYRSLPVQFDGYSFDAGIEQMITKNGLRLVTPIARRWVGDVYAVHTKFLEDSAVDSFMTYGTSVAFKATKRFNLVLGANYDQGDNFKSYSVGLSSAWNW